VPPRYEPCFRMKEEWRTYPATQHLSLNLIVIYYVIENKAFSKYKNIKKVAHVRASDPGLQVFLTS